MAFVGKHPGEGLEQFCAAELYGSRIIARGRIKMMPSLSSRREAAMPGCAGIYSALAYCTRSIIMMRHVCWQAINLCQKQVNFYCPPRPACVKLWISCMTGLACNAG